MKRLFVINPHAGGGMSPRAIERLENYFRHRVNSFDAIVSRSRDDVIIRTRQALKNEVEQIVAVGGDGTVNAVANGFFENDELVNSGACLAVAKAGSGSDYFRGLNRTSQRDWREIVLNPTIRRVDAARLQVGGEADPLYFINMATFGMSADVCRRKAAMSKYWPKSLRYFLPTVRGLFQTRPSNVRITVDGQTHERQAICIMVAKGAYSGGGMLFGKNVALDDGRFEVTLFRPLPVWQMLIKTPKLYSGELDNEPSIEKLMATRVDIEATPPLLAELDGDVIGDAPVSTRVIHQRLAVCFPSAE